MGLRKRTLKNARQFISGLHLFLASAALIPEVNQKRSQVLVIHRESRIIAEFFIRLQHGQRDVVDILRRVTGGQVVGEAQGVSDHGRAVGLQVVLWRETTVKTGPEMERENESK